MDDIDHLFAIKLSVYAHG